jgi:hypothetical protein
MSEMDGFVGVCKRVGELINTAKERVQSLGESPKQVFVTESEMASPVSMALTFRK